MVELFNISRKTALVTGGSRGIGEMIAEAFVMAGAKTYISSRSKEACMAVSDRLSKFGECISCPADLSTMQGITEFRDRFSELEGNLDILVNNAGATWGEPLDTFPEKGWDRVMDINLKAPFFLTQSLLANLRAAVSKNGTAKVINIGSIEGTTLPVVKESFAYPASKAALHHLTRVMAGTLGSENITVNTIAPGPFMSKMTAFLLEDMQAHEELARKIPLKRIGSQNDIVGLSIFLASSASDYITGETIHLDGGYAQAR